MTRPPKYIARVIDVDAGKNRVVVIAGDRQEQIGWRGPLPETGDVYELAPDFRIVRKLCGGNPAGNINNGDSLRWRKADARGRTRMATLEKRHLIKRAVRDYLHEEGFIEIDTPLLVRGSTPDAEIESFGVDGRYLATSTEYQLKRLEIGGFDRSYTLTQNFRKGDTGRYRNPEFTMLEWARVGAALPDIEHDMEQLVWRAHQALGGGALAYQGKNIDLRPPFDRLTVKEATRKITGVDLPDFSTASLAQAVAAAKINVPGADSRDAPQLFSVLMDYLQEQLGLQKPVFLREWPLFQTASAPEHAAGKFAERSELVIAGIELSDGFPSLTDAGRQQANFGIQNARRKELGRPAVETDAAYLNALREGFPSGAGMALGLDRLVMILTDQPDIASVLAFNWDEL